MSILSSNNIFANIVRDHLFWHRTADLKAKLVLGAPNGNAKHQLGKGIGAPNGNAKHQLGKGIGEGIGNITRI